MQLRPLICNAKIGNSRHRLWRVNNKPAHQVPAYCSSPNLPKWLGDGAQEALASPIENTLFFAGEATDISGHNGTVHGAIASGRRAASEIQRSLR